MGDIVRSGEEKRKAILNYIDTVKKYARHSDVDNKFTEALDDIQQRIEDANVLETYFTDFGVKEYTEADAIFQEIHAKVKLNFRKRDLENKRRFQRAVAPLAVCIFSLYYFLVQRAKFVPADFIHGAVCVSIGVLVATLFYIFYTFILYFIGERVRAIEEWSFTKQVLIVLLAATVMYFPFYAIIQFYSINLYLFVSPYLLHLAQGAAKMDIGSVFAIASLVLGDLAALFASWDFVQKKLRKQKNDILNEEHAE
jgi:hypothetical protein